MKANLNVFIPFRFLSLNPARFLSIGGLPYPEAQEDQTESLSSPSTDPSDLLRRWGCTADDISKIFQRRPSLRRMEHKNLQSKLKILSDLGIESSDLTKILNCRPRFLNCRINRCLEERLEFFQTLFGTKQVLLKAIVRNPSLLTYDFHKQIKPTVAFYEQLGLSRSDLISMLLARPTLIPRSSLDDEKMDYIRRTGVEKGTRMFKHVITLFAISRSETIRQKVANLEKYGFTEDEVFRLFGRSPFLLTLSVDKVQRNMTFILATMKLSASLVLDNPCLLFLNLETAMKPRYFVGARLLDSQIEKVDDLKGRIYDESKKIWRVALPGVLSRVASFGSIVVTQSFIGHISELDLAAYALVQTLTVRFVNGILIGMSSATETLCGQAYGAGQYHMMGIYLQRSWIVDFMTLTVLLPFLSLPLYLSYSVRMDQLWKLLDTFPSGYMKNAEVAISAFSICLNINGWEFMISLGFLGAACVRVANELGKGDAKATKFSIKVLVGTSVIIGLFFWNLCLIFGNKLGYLFSNEKAVADSVADLSTLLAFSILLNSIYPVLSGVAVGAGLQSTVAIINLCCFYLIGVPIGALLGYVVHLQVKVIFT
ncbi:protein detoxification 24 [Nicotiana attenuata]|uniref:Protein DETOXIFICATION n=1 Tax=Nicotiana attenuata TaxID=49451 RepID=A0A1J6JUU9_NICAT|nr:protein detoxification 24 [Nicotiana attenuata]